MKWKLLISAGVIGLFSIFLNEYLPQETIHPTEITQTAEAETSAVTQACQSKIMSMDLDADDAELLMKIAMAEAEDQDTKGKALVMLVVLNRVWDKGFPNNIRDVIYQKNQFAPIHNGRFDKSYPDDDCSKALNLVLLGWDESQGALYFEAKSKSTWHRDNLEFLFKHQDHYFYTEHENNE